MEKPVRIIRHSVIPDSGSFEVRFADGSPSRYWYWEDNAGRRAVSMSVTMTQDQAKAAAQDFARKATARTSSELGPSASEP